MIDLYEYAVEKVSEHINGTPIKHQNKLQFRCVFCGDSKQSLGKKRGWLIRDKASFHYHCYNCGRHYNPYEFLMELEGKTYKEVRSDLFSIYKEIGFSDAIKNILNGENFTTINDNDDVQEEPKRITSFTLRSTWEDIEKHETAYNMIKDRCIYDAPNLPKRFQLFYDVKFNKIVIPWYRNNELKYYQYRTVGKVKGSKYIFPKNTEKDIYGMDNIDPDFPYIFFMEGVFESIWVKNGICIGGVMITAHQRKILRTLLETHELVYFPNNPFVDTRGSEEILKLAENDKKQKIILWDKNNIYKDINDEMKATRNFNKYMDEQYLLDNIIYPSKYKILLKFLKK